jgi:thiol-disulfide isomerase/thioredoxin
MKIKLIVLLLVITISSLFSQGKASFSPEMPKIGDAIKIKYDPASSVLKDAKTISANLLVMREVESPVWQEVKMAKKGSEWTGEYKIKDKDTRLLLIKFVSDKKTDDNDENVWDLSIYGNDNKLLNSVQECRGVVNAQGDYYGFKKKRDLDKAVSDFENELKQNPGSWRSQTMLWKIQMRRNPGDEVTNKIKASIDVLYEKNKNNEEALVGLIPYYEQIGLKEKADAIRNEEIAKKPKGAVAKNKAFREVSMEKDPAKRITQFEKILTTFNLNNDEKSNVLMNILSYYTKEKNWEKVESIITTAKPLDGRLYSLAASKMFDDEKKSGKGIEYARKSIELLSNATDELKPSYTGKSEWKDECNWYLIDAKHIIALENIKNSKFDEAEKTLKEITDISGDKSMFAETLIDCYIKAGKNEDALKLSKEIILKDGATEEIVKLFKTAYIKVKGSDAGFETMLDDLKNSAKKGAKEQLVKELVNKPAPQFELKGLDGKLVKLADLKGKIVVVDFWATWCGPCKSSFPFLQKVYEKYKSNPDIVILALDTWERVKGEEKEKLVKKFISDNKYTFTVLYDDNFVEQYGVTGIPTKFIIDKDGMIQFKTIGFDGGEKMMDGLDMEFEILLNNEHKK